MEDLGKRRGRPRVRLKRRIEERVRNVGNKGLFIGNFKLHGKGTSLAPLGWPLPSRPTTSQLARHAHQSSMNRIARQVGSRDQAQGRWSMAFASKAKVEGKFKFALSVHKHCWGTFALDALSVHQGFSSLRQFDDLKNYTTSPASRGISIGVSKYTTNNLQLQGAWS